MSDPETQERGLRPASIGTAHIVFFVIATAGPLVSLVGAAPAAIALGDPDSIPTAYILIAVLYLLFSVGFTAMGRRIENAGAFYAYVGEGLGPAWGAGTAFVAILAYSAVQLATYALFGIFAGQALGAHAPPWWLSAFAAALTVQVLGRRSILLSGRLLGALLIAEVAILVLLDAAIITGGQVSSPPILVPDAPWRPGFGVMLAFLIPCFLGFEATAIFGEEARDPQRTIPRATYAAVLAIGSLYAASSWAILSAYSPDGVALAASMHSTTFFFDVAERTFGPWAREAMSALMLTSMFAALLSLHNAIARYLFALGRAGLLPVALSRTHPSYASPHIAGTAQTITMFAALGVAALLGLDPYASVFAVSAALAATAILAVQTTASAAVVGYFRKRRDSQSRLTTFWAPLAATLGLASAVALLTSNLPAITGSTSRYVALIPAVALVAGLLGMGLERRRPKSYFGRAGRQS